MKPIPRFLAAAACAAIPAANAAPLDVCAMLAQADAQAIVGKIKNVTTIKPQAGLLGECTFEGTNATLSIAARPAQQYQETVQAAGERNKPLEAAQGLAGKAVKSKYGLLYQPTGKPYFLQVIGRHGDTPDIALAIEGAKRLKQ